MAPASAKPSLSAPHVAGARPAAGAVRREREEPHLATQDGYLQRSPHPSSLYDVLNLILDKGLVIDVYVRASLVGIELLTIDARIVIASVDTYLRFAEAVNRLDLQESAGVGLPDLLEKGVEKTFETGARVKTRGALEGAKEKVEGAKEKVEETIEEAKEAVEGIIGRGDKRSS
jgi:gas vesicle structural protein